MGMNQMGQKGRNYKKANNKKVAIGTDIISNDHNFYQALQDSSKIKLYFITDEYFKRVEKSIAKNNILPLSGTMKLHQVFSDVAEKFNVSRFKLFL